MNWTQADFHKLPDEIRWFFDGQFRMADALRDGYVVVESKFAPHGDVIIVKPFRAILVAPNVALQLRAAGLEVLTCVPSSHMSTCWSDLFSAAGHDAHVDAPLRSDRRAD